MKIVNLEKNLLADEELLAVLGGKIIGKGRPENKIPFCCNGKATSCGNIFAIKAGARDVKCPKCNTRYHIDG